MKLKEIASEYEGWYEGCHHSRIDALIRAVGAVLDGYSNSEEALQGADLMAQGEKVRYTALGYEIGPDEVWQALLVADSLKFMDLTRYLEVKPFMSKSIDTIRNMFTKRS